MQAAMSLSVGSIAAPQLSSMEIANLLGSVEGENK